MRQVEAPWSAHWPSGSWPTGTAMQVPWFLSIAHDMQFPVQVVEQQTPCAQWVDMQSASAAQLAPGGLRPQLPLLHVVPAVQSASAAQTVLHDPTLAPVVLQT